MSSAVWATLKTASPSGTSRRERRARVARAHRLRRYDGQRLQSGRGLEAHGVAVGADHEAAAQRGRDVVGVPLQLARQREQVGVQLEQVIGGHEARDDRRGARAEAAGERDLENGSGT